MMNEKINMEINMEIPVALYQELIIYRDRMRTVERLVSESKYDVDRSELARICDIELQPVENNA
ncbi:MAG: hypothetical protein NC548_56800 [Lachnospiraceae bacterium]|nr:hypothetical protein [Lachnospiraceae bacterium]